ncbi:glycoside hydrolase [Raphidocelis subcapitata]|uniref:Glycoside hydrolase n=1 Tax=Raphidocelis subcapitata TaxID=307507 RepID=A0A2V0PHR1_9CHLO|nr:glycoside hydrolase [Raphidocelis subcapitata]|eukprot:GBF99351.1 glycoside hydrolase [Raphidocelis subcapitata]
MARLLRRCALPLLIASLGWGLARAELDCSSYGSTYDPPPRGAPPDAVKLKDAGFVRAKDGSAVQMKAISWFGVNDNGTAKVESLWSGGDAAALDVATIAYQLRAHGFNALRLPFTFADLRAPVKKAWERQGCGKVTLGSGGTAPGSTGAAAAPAGGQGGAAACSWYLPDSSPLDRYLWSLQWFVANGFYVLAEFRPAGPDATARNGAAFVDAWKWLWRRAACLPNFREDLAGRVFVDLMGDPDAAGHRWEAVAEPDGGVVPGLTELYLAAMDALWADTPERAVFFVEGAGQGGDDRWGSGFDTDKATIAVNEFSDPNPFFKALLKKPYRAAVVVCPHVYDNAAPPPALDAGLPPPGDGHGHGGQAPPRAAPWPAGPGPIKVMDTTFGYLARDGYCADKDCQRFPVAVGEFTSRLANAPRLAELNAFAAQLAEEGVEYGGVGTWRFWGFEDGGRAGASAGGSPGAS